jgi:hypothetical protein
MKEDGQATRKGKRKEKKSGTTPGTSQARINSLDDISEE